MYKFTICFIKQGDNILMLNREKPSWMGSWNGVGGKIEVGETPEEGILREIKEETGLSLSGVTYKGVVTWVSESDHLGGMYTFVAELPNDQVYETPIKTREGILDWKHMDWLCHPDNSGVAANVPYYIKDLFNDEENYEHRCFFQDDQLISVEKYRISEENQTVNKQIKKELQVK